MKLALLSLAIVFQAAAAEYAVLATGSRLRIDRHEAEGGMVRLYANGGSMEMPAGAISSFERDDYTPPPPPPAQPAQPAQAAAPDIDKVIEDAANKYGLPASLIRSVIKAESNFRPDAVSPKGAVGLMQLMPGTARMLGADPTHVVQNVEAGTRYLRELIDRYNWGAWSALAAYNAGPGAVDRYKGVPPYRETQAYVRRVWNLYQHSGE